MIGNQLYHILVLLGGALFKIMGLLGRRVMFKGENSGAAFCVFLSTPQHMLNAIEFTHIKKAGELHIVILDNRGSGLEDAVRACGSRFFCGFASIQSVDCRLPLGREKIFRNLKNGLQLRKEIIALAKEFSGYCLVIGRTRSLENLHGLIARSSKQSPVFLDDGLGTMRELATPGMPNDARPPEFNRNVSLFKSCMFGRRLSYGESRFFTALDTARDRENICHNYYRRFSSVGRALAISGELHFLGQPLTKKFISYDEYISCLKALSNEEEGYWVYYAHPGEDVGVLEAIKIDLGWEIRSPKVGYELHLLERGALPRRVGSFFSAALFVISQLQLKDLDCFAIDLRDCKLDGARKDWVQFPYEKLSSAGVRLVPSSTLLY